MSIKSVASYRSLDDISAVITKGTTPTTHGYEYVSDGVPFVRATNLGNKFVDFRNDVLYIDSACAQAFQRSKILPGDVLLAIAGTIGRSSVVPNDAPLLNCNQAVCIIRPTSEIDSVYLKHWLGSRDAVDQIAASTVTGVISNLSLSQVRSLQVPLPPVPEQRRIAAILDKADALRAKRREAIAKLDQLLQSAFLDMFGDPVTNPKGLVEAPLGEVADFYAGNSLPEAVPFVGQCDGYLALKVSDLNLPGNQDVITTANQWIGKFTRGAIACPSGAIVFPKRGGAIGTNKKRRLARKAYLDPNLMGVSPKVGTFHPTYLYHWFKRFNLSDIASGSSVPQLNKRDLAPLTIQIPNQSDQERFSEIGEKIDRQLKIHTKSLRATDNLFDALQQGAFESPHRLG